MKSPVSNSRSFWSDKWNFYSVIGFLWARALALAVTSGRRDENENFAAPRPPPHRCVKTNDWETAPLCRLRVDVVLNFGRWYRKSRQSRWKHDEKARARCGSGGNTAERHSSTTNSSSTHKHAHSQRSSLPFQRVKWLQRKTWKKKLRVARSWIIGAVAQTHPSSTPIRSGGVSEEIFLSSARKQNSTRPHRDLAIETTFARRLRVGFVFLDRERWWTALEIRFSVGRFDLEFTFANRTMDDLHNFRIASGFGCALFTHLRADNGWKALRCGDQLLGN